MDRFTNTPDDILELIIDAVNDDFSSLLALSLCCRTLRWFCTRRIFSTLYLGGSSARSSTTVLKTRCIKLRAILSSNPSLASFVKTLSINQPIQLTEKGRVDPSMWICNNTALIDILDTLSSSPVSSLIITNHFQPEPEWASLCVWFRAALHPILRQPAFRKLTITGIKRIPTEFYAQCLDLRSLEISLPVSKKPGASTSFLRGMARHRLSRLNTLKIGLSFPIRSTRDEHPYGDIKLYGPTIKELKITCPFVPPSASRLDFHHLTSLTSLDMSYTRVPLDFLTASLETIPSAHPSLQYIRIAFWPPTCDYDSNTSFTFQSFVSSLLRLRKPLSRLHLGSKGVLQSIDIRIWTPLGVDVRPLEEFTRSNLTWEGSENVLKVEL